MVDFMNRLQELG